jgi:hypothetical protein
MVPWVVELLIHPENFFSSLDRKKVNLWIPGIIVILSGLGSVLPFLPAVFMMRESASQFMYAIQLIEILPVPVIVWCIYSVLFYFLGRLAAGSGSFELVMQNTGYGMLPGTITSLVMPIFPLVLGGFPVLPVVIVGQTIPQSLWVTLSIGCTLIIPLLGICWNGYLWIAGLSVAHAIPRNVSWKIVAPVCIASALVVAMPLIFTFLIMATIPVR